MNVHSRSGERMPGDSPFGQTQSLLRFMACGSVDHGKSTLLGRLLYESKQLFTDQLEALAADSRKYGTQGEELDYSLLLDGLAAEREQNITIDVAYRFFSTPRRKFIVIDTPGHEQYTANMATGASVADLALVLVSANEGLTRQTRRHIAIVGMLGIADIVLVVNKMDRAGWRQDTFRSLEAEFRDIAADFGVGNVVAIPVAAKTGDNIASHSPHMPWYRGTTLLDYLEHVEPARASAAGPLRMPIQLVNRPDARFRGYSGLIVSGAVEVGMPVRLFPSGTSFTHRAHRDVRWRSRSRRSRAVGDADLGGSDRRFARRHHCGCGPDTGGDPANWCAPFLDERTAVAAGAEIPCQACHTHRDRDHRPGFGDHRPRSTAHGQYSIDRTECDRHMHA